MLKNHLDLIGRNEPIQRKARFWQSYVRALKGTDDMRAPDRVTPRPRGIFRPFLSDFHELSSPWPYGKSMYDEPIHAVDRISVPGYRYLPVSRETYGYTPRNLYPVPYRPDPIFRARNAKEALESNLKHLNETENLFQSEETLTKSRPKFRREKELTPSEKGFPVYSPGVRRPLSDVLQPLEDRTLSKISRESWWWGYPSLRPDVKEFKALPSHLRDSYLSPSTFHWYEHPFRPLGPFKPAFSYYLWRRTYWENVLDEIDAKIRDAVSLPLHPVYP